MFDLLQDNINRLTEMTKRMRLLGLDMALSTGNGGSHLGGSFSCMEILAALYGEILNIAPETAESEDRDIFIPSKNHCVLAHIPALAEAGFITKEECLEFQKNGGRLTGYPMRKEIGLEYSGGSLGMAISVVIGMALAERDKERENKAFLNQEDVDSANKRRLFYVLMGDAELNEGSIWEAFMSAAHYKLDNVIAIIDRNHLSYDGDTEDVMALGNLAEKMNSFGWYVSECNGRDVGDILRAFDERYIEGEKGKWNLKPEAEGKPQIVIVDTIKGMGVSFMEGRPEWHHRRLSQSEYEQAKAEILAQ
jgi:Transketolase, N-terminal subunit